MLKDRPMLDVLCFDCGGMYQVAYGVSNPTKQCPKCQEIKTPL
jgi:ribosomal protein S27E